MNKYIVNISKSIEGRFIVEAESLEDAYDAAVNYGTLFEVSDVAGMLFGMHHH